MKHIVIVTGSPREGGNSTILAETFAKAAEEKGHEVRFFDSVKNKVEGCVACKKCWSKGKPCVTEDGFNEFAGMLESADVLVLASPVYWGTYPSQLKALIDKFFAYGIKRTKVDIRGSRTMYLLACGDGKKETAFQTITGLAKGFAEYMQWELAGCVTAPELVEAGEVLHTEAMAEAEALGRGV